MLFPAILVLASCGLSQAGVPLERRNNANPLPAFSPVPQLAKNSSVPLVPLYEPYSKDKPKFQNEVLIQHLSANPGTRLDRLDLASLGKRQELPVGTCAPGIPCSNGACCSDTGVCSYAPSSCGPDVCISNCDAKAPCGEYADPASAKCPLNVCCSEFGFCKSGRSQHIYIYIHISRPAC